MPRPFALRICAPLVLLAAISLGSIKSVLGQSGPATTPHVKVGPLYVPPAGDLPKTRTNSLNRGARRSADKDFPLLSFIAPEHAGLTLSEQPRLYWYLSAATAFPVKVALIRVEDGDEQYEVTTTTRTEGGFHCLDLAHENVHLEVGKQYQFVVEIIPDIGDHQNDIATSGVITRRLPPDSLVKNPAAGDSLERAELLLQSSFWFDGIAIILAQAEAHQDKPEWLSLRNATFDEVGLHQVLAEFPKP